MPVLQEQKPVQTLLRTKAINCALRLATARFRSRRSHHRLDQRLPSIHWLVSANQWRDFVNTDISDCLSISPLVGAA